MIRAVQGEVLVVGQGTWAVVIYGLSDCNGRCGCGNVVGSDKM